MHNVMLEQMWAELLSVQGQMMACHSIISCATYAIWLLKQIDFCRNNVSVQKVSPTTETSQDILVYWHQNKRKHIFHAHAYTIVYIMPAFDPL